MAKKKNVGNANISGEPLFAEIQPTGDPTKFKIAHSSDTPLYNLIEKKLLQPVPTPRDPANMVIKLQDVLGAAGKNKVAAIEKANKIVFHCAGDTGSTRGLQTENLVSDKMVNDFTDHSNDTPFFLFHLGDEVYSWLKCQKIIKT